MSTATLLASGLYFGEGPRWHAGRLWFSDFYDHAVKSVDAAGQVRTELTIDDHPSGLGWLPDGRLLVVSMNRRQLLRVDPDGVRVHADLAAVAAHREEFEFDRHCGGPNLETTPNEIIRRIEGYSGVKVAQAFAIPDLDREVKWHCKYARQNGIHVSPTFMVDGLIRADMSSGDAVADWASRLDA